MLYAVYSKTDGAVLKYIECPSYYLAVKQIKVGTMGLVKCAIKSDENDCMVINNRLVFKKSE